MAAKILEIRLYFGDPPIFSWSAYILSKRQYFMHVQIFCVYFQYLLCIFVCANIFGGIVLKPRFKIDVVVVVIWSIVIIINSVLTLQVSTASLPHDREPCEIKVVSNHTCSLHTCFCAGYRRERVLLSGLINGRNQFNSWGFPQVPHSGPGLCRTPAINLSPVLLTPLKNDRRWQRLKSLKFIAGVNDTAEKLFTGVNVTADKFFSAVNDTGD